VPHPGDHSSFGSLLDRDALRSGHGAAANGRGMMGHDTGQLLGEIGVSGLKRQEFDHRPEEILDLLGLGLLTASGVGFLLLCETLGGSFGFEVRSNPFDGRCRDSRHSEQGNVNGG
jgi:hypothetical protein